ncbi:MAG TPA: VOC family protein [Solirubrobacteraceae bacterium]|nr:VOC family protein [Solirubrobacteraceae bacterium]
MNDATGLGTRKLAQIAFVVRDIDEASRRWAGLLGVPVPEVQVTDPGREARASYRGAPTDAQAKLAFFDLGGVQLELIEPVGEDSAWAEGLSRRGESVHHLAFWVDDMKRSAAFLEGRGLPLIHRGDMGEGQYAYFDGEEQLGTMVELLERERTELDGS